MLELRGREGIETGGSEEKDKGKGEKFWGEKNRDERKDRCKKEDDCGGCCGRIVSKGFVKGLSRRRWSQR